MNLFVFNGTICKDIEMRYTKNKGMSIISSSLAFNKKDANGNQSTVFLEFVAFGKTAEFINQYYSKGDMLCGQGEIAMDEWQDKDTGKQRTKHKILISQVDITKTPKAWANGANSNTQQSVQALAQNIANSGAVMGVTITNYADNGGNASYNHNQAPQNYSNQQPQNTAQNLAQELNEMPF